MKSLIFNITKYQNEVVSVFKAFHTKKKKRTHASGALDNAISRPARVLGLVHIKINSSLMCHQINHSIKV